MEVSRNRHRALRFFRAVPPNVGDWFRRTDLSHKPDSLSWQSRAKLADIRDLEDPGFGRSLAARLPRDFDQPPRKLWEYYWIAQRFADMKLGGGEKKILGLGVGQEPLSFHFAHLAGQVVGTDLFSRDAIWKEARISLKDMGQCSPFPYPEETLTFQNMDMRQLAFDANTFDVVWSCSSVEHVQTLAEFVRIFEEIHRVLKPGGIALITTEFSLDSPYLLPGVLSLWKDSALFGNQLKGLTLEEPVDLSYAETEPGHEATARRDFHRWNRSGARFTGPSGMCQCVGYTRLVPVAFALRKTSGHFSWPKNLNAPPWYSPFAKGLVRMGQDRMRDAILYFQRALSNAETSGAKLHSYRFLIEAMVHAGKAAGVQNVLVEIENRFTEWPDDSDALDLIAHVAAGQGMANLAQRCWDKAFYSRSALPIARLEIRCRQLEAELQTHGVSREARYLSSSSEAAWHEASSAHGPAEPKVKQARDRLCDLRRDFGLEGDEMTSASEPLAAAPGSARPMVYVGNDLALTKTIYGHKMYVDSRSQLGACFLLDGYWEEWITRHLKRFVKPGMHAVDIGANMGFYTILLCDLVGATGKVTAFEPYPKYFDILRKNMEVNGFQHRCNLQRKMVHAKPGRKWLDFYTDFGTGGVQASEQFFQHHGNSQLNQVEVETVSLDELFEDESTIVNFIKMDAEGCEPFIFEGMTGILDRHPELTIFCEFCPPLLRGLGVDPMQFLHELRNKQFRISELSPTGIAEIEFTDLVNADWAELLLIREAS